MEESKAQRKNKPRLNQTDFPAYSLEHALRVPIALLDNYAGHSSKPIDVALAMNISPTSSQFRMLTGAAIAYGLTEGGAQSQEISLTELSRKILKPLEDGDDLIARKEALLRPKVIGEFLKKYDGAAIPKDTIAQNVLNNMGVPDNRTLDVFSMILEGAEGNGLIREMKGKKYVNLSLLNTPSKELPPLFDESEYENSEDKVEEHFNKTLLISPTPLIVGESNKKVFITHGKNKSFIEPIKKLLNFGELEPVVSVEKQSVSQPVPEKVMNDMRNCGAAIIHVEDELTLLDKDAKEHVMLNPNVLIEIGAAMALYKKRFILLVKEGVKLPSNLQGLYEVRYSGDSMDGEATIKLLEAINAMKNEK